MGDNRSVVPLTNAIIRQMDHGVQHAVLRFLTALRDNLSDNDMKNVLGRYSHEVQHQAAPYTCIYVRAESRHGRGSAVDCRFTTFDIVTTDTTFTPIDKYNTSISVNHEAILMAPRDAKQIVRLDVCCSNISQAIVTVSIGARQLYHGVMSGNVTLTATTITSPKLRKPRHSFVSRIVKPRLRTAVATSPHDDVKQQQQPQLDNDHDNEQANDDYTPNEVLLNPVPDNAFQNHVKDEPPLKLAARPVDDDEPMFSDDDTSTSPTIQEKDDAKIEQEISHSMDERVTSSRRDDSDDVRESSRRNTSINEQSSRSDRANVDEKPLLLECSENNVLIDDDASVVAEQQPTAVIIDEPLSRKELSPLRPFDKQSLHQRSSTARSEFKGSVSDSDRPNITIPVLPMGQVISFYMLSTWGSSTHVGIAGIDVFLSSGQLIRIPSAPSKLFGRARLVNDRKLPSCACTPTTALPAHRAFDGGLSGWTAPVRETSPASPGVTKGGRGVVTDHLLKSLPLVSRTRTAETTAFFMEHSRTSAPCLILNMSRHVSVAMVRVWNYDKDVQIGVKQMAITIDMVPVFYGEIRSADQGSECILFTTDTEILDNIATNDPFIDKEAQSLSQRPSDNSGQELAISEQAIESPDAFAESHEDGEYLECESFELLLHDSWGSRLRATGDKMEIGLTGLAVMRADGSLLPIIADDIEIMHGERGTFESESAGILVDGFNTDDASHMCAAKPTVIRVDVESCFERMGPSESPQDKRIEAIVMYNYNATNTNDDNDSVDIGVRHVGMIIDCGRISCSLLLRRGPGYYDGTDYGQMCSPWRHSAYYDESSRCYLFVRIIIHSLWSAEKVVSIGGMKLLDSQGADIPFGKIIIPGSKFHLESQHLTRELSLPYKSPLVIDLWYDVPIDLYEIHIMNWVQNPKRSIKNMTVLCDGECKFNGIVPMARDRKSYAIRLM